MSEGLAQDPYVAARAGFELATFRSKSTDSSQCATKPHNGICLREAGGGGRKRRKSKRRRRRMKKKKKRMRKPELHAPLYKHSIVVTHNVTRFSTPSKSWVLDLTTDQL